MMLNIVLSNRFRKDLKLAQTFSAKSFIRKGLSVNTDF